MHNDTQTVQIIVMDNGQQSLATVDSFMSSVDVITSDGTKIESSHTVELSKQEFKEFNELAITNEIPYDSIIEKAQA